MQPEPWHNKLRPGRRRLLCLSAGCLGASSSSQAACAGARAACATALRVGLCECCQEWRTRLGCSLCNIGLLGHEVDGIDNKDDGAGLVGIFPEAAADLGVPWDIHKLHRPATPPLHKQSSSSGSISCSSLLCPGALMSCTGLPQLPLHLHSSGSGRGRLPGRQLHCPGAPTSCTRCCPSHVQ